MLWLSREPSNDRDWSPDNAVLPRIEHHDGGQSVGHDDGGGHGNDDCERITVHDVRCFRYRSTRDFDVAYEDRTYRLDTLDSLDFFVAPFGGIAGMRREGGKAHTFVSFGFGREHLAISIEVRRVRGDRYHPVRGLFRAYELIYVFADERDVIGVRTAFTRSPVYRFPIRTQRASMRAMLLEMAARANRLGTQPEFYNTLTNTCTTNLVHHVNAIAPGRIPPSPWVLLPGYSARLLYRLGLIRTDLPFEEVFADARIGADAGRDPDHPDFSRRIRAPAPAEPRDA